MEETQEDEPRLQEGYMDLNAKLIKIIEQYPQLYNFDNVGSEIKQLYWKDVTVKLKGEPEPSKDEVAQVRQRWKNLRDSYVKDFKVVKLMKDHNLSIQQRKRWRYAKLMQFLNPFITSKGPVKTIGEINGMAALKQLELTMHQSKQKQEKLANDDDNGTTRLSLSLIRPYPELSIEDDKLFCKACKKFVKISSKIQVDSHVQTSGHISNLTRFLTDESATNMQLTSDQPSTSKIPDSQAEQLNDNDDVTFIETIKKEEDDDSFEETVDETFLLTKEELVDIISQPDPSSNPGGSSSRIKRESISIDYDDLDEPTSKKTKSESLSSSDQPGTSYELVNNGQLAQETSDQLIEQIQQNTALTGMIDTGGNLDLFFESVLALAKTLSPLDQVILQRNIANVVFEMKIKQLTKNKFIPK